MHTSVTVPYGRSHTRMSEGRNQHSDRVVGMCGRQASGENRHLGGSMMEVTCWKQHNRKAMTPFIRARRIVKQTMLMLRKHQQRTRSGLATSRRD